jgi:hypothetical protein
VYATGWTLKPARCAGTPAARLTTKPDCSSRFSTLHNAQSPVRGHSDPVGALLLAAITDGAVLPTEEVVAVDEADPLGAGDDRLQEIIAIGISVSSG